MNRFCRSMRWPAMALVLACLGGCDDPQIYGSVGVSTGWGSHSGWGSGVHTSISVGGRIR